MTQESTPPASQSDEALVEELARTMWNTPNAIDANHPEMTFGSGVVFARAILPILHRERASARTGGKREGIEEAAKVAESAMFNEYGRPQPVLVARLRALAEKQP